MFVKSGFRCPISSTNKFLTMIPAFLCMHDACFIRHNRAIDIPPLLTYSSLSTMHKGANMTSIPKTSPEKELVKVLDAADVVDFIEYLQSGKRIMWLNFRAGIAKGFGVTVGMTLVIGVLAWVLTMLVDLPLIGEYFEDAKFYITDYAENTNYKTDFEEMNRLLQEINENTEQETTPESPLKE